MATPGQLSLLTYFRPQEFRRPEMLHFPFLIWLDAVRDRAGFPFHLTSDGRDTIPPGGSATSLHLRGRAVDIRFPFLPDGRQDGERLARFVAACLAVAPPPGEGGREIGLEATAPGGPHLHLGLYGDGRPDWIFTR